MTLLRWSVTQPWWPVVSSLMDQGMVVVLHLPKSELPPMAERHLLKRKTGGQVHIEDCGLNHWHLSMVLPFSSRERVASQAESEVAAKLDPAGLFHRHGPVVGEA